MASDERSGSGTNEAWLRALAGKPESELSDAERTIVRALRETVRARDAGGTGDDPADDADDERELQKLKFRLRREGLLESSAPSAARTRWRMPLSIAAALVVALGVSLLVPKLLPDDGGIRGGGKVQVVEADDAAERQAQIAQVLEGVGIHPTTYPLGVFRGLDAQVPAAQRGSLVEPLQKLGVSVPQDGRLVLEIRGKK